MLLVENEMVVEKWWNYFMLRVLVIFSQLDVGISSCYKYMEKCIKKMF
jgi:hypothetical protein